MRKHWLVGTYVGAAECECYTDLVMHYPLNMIRIPRPLSRTMVMSTLVHLDLSPFFVLILYQAVPLLTRSHVGNNGVSCTGYIGISLTL